MRLKQFRILTTLALFLVAVGCGRDPDPTAPPTATPPLVSALADLSLRSGPGAQTDEVAPVGKNEQLALLGTARGVDCTQWVLVRTAAGQEGWVRPLLVNVDIENSVLQTVPLPTPDISLPTSCTDGLALVEIDNNYGIDLEAFMAGSEPGFTFSIASGAMQRLCLIPGEYCYDLTDGTDHETGALFFPGGECTCWHWGGPPPTAGSCRCSDDFSVYQRP